MDLFDSESVDAATATMQLERLTIQKKAFTKWANSFLKKISLEVTDLYKDFGDGILLIALLECLFGAKLPKPVKSAIHFHKLENVAKALSFLSANQVKLENISAQNIVDGKEPKLILGLVWTLVHKFQMQEIHLEGDAKSAKDALLLWCQRKTKNYANVHITNFTTSWKDGLAFNAIIHAHRPDLIDYMSLKTNKAVANMNIAFDVAEKHLGIASLLDPQGS